MERRRNIMSAQSLAEKLLAMGKSATAAAKDGETAADAGDPPVYIYGQSLMALFSIAFMIQPGAPQQGMFWFAQIAVNFGGGVLLFESNVEFQDNGVTRQGWIYTAPLGAQGASFSVYFPDYADQSGCYNIALTTLPYTQGQPPSGLANSVCVSRSPA
jgi:hypothetical protein